MKPQGNIRRTTVASGIYDYKQILEDALCLNKGRRMLMETIKLILTLIGTTATVISTIIAIRAKNEAKEILYEIRHEKNRNVLNDGDVAIKNVGINTGIISGINTGEVNENARK